MLLVQYAYLEENPNDVHVNINGVDLGEVQELVDQRKEKESQPLIDMDFWLVDIVHPPSVHVRTGRELRPQGGGGERGGGYPDWRREGILPPKGIRTRVSNKIKLGRRASEKKGSKEAKSRTKMNWSEEERKSTLNTRKSGHMGRNPNKNI